MKYVLSDVHGNYKAWSSILKQIKLSSSDDLYILGDVIDRGKHGLRILSEIMDNPNMHMILGNHEYMMLNALDCPYTDNEPEKLLRLSEKIQLWFLNGGEVTFNAFEVLPKQKQEAITKYLHSVPITRYIELNGVTYVLCHANWEQLFASLPESARYLAVWDRARLQDAMEMLEFSNPNAVMVIGHTPTYNFSTSHNEIKTNKHFMSVFKFRNLLAIDCGAGFPNKIEGRKQGRLACVRLDDMHVFYSESR